MTLTADAVIALAPDASSAKAARGLLSPAKWSSLGHDDAAVWGACQGSGSQPYQTQVDLAGPAFKCSCPSRKFPCKHGLALLLLRAQDGGRFAREEPPAWVREWLGARKDKAEKQEQRAAKRAEQVDASAVDPSVTKAEAEAREARRWTRIASGMADVERWLGDLVQRGIATATPEHRAAWRAFGARMVDAQAPGLAAWFEDAASLVGTGGDGAERLLAKLGRLQLVVEAVKRRDSLPPGTVADLRATLGWPLDRDDVLARGEHVDDVWSVVGQACDENDRGLVERRVWLWGRASGRRALVLEFARGRAGFEASWVTGSAFEGALAFYPSASPLRGLVARRGSTERMVWPTGDPIDELRALSVRLAHHPWLPLAPVLLSRARILVRGHAGWTAEGGGHAWPLDLDDPDASLLLAASGGDPVDVWGEWDGASLRPLTAWGGEGVWTVSTGAGS